MEYNKLIAWGRNWGELRPGGGTSWSVWLTQSEGVLAPFSLDEVLPGGGLIRRRDNKDQETELV